MELPFEKSRNNGNDGNDGYGEKQCSRVCSEHCHDEFCIVFFLRIFVFENAIFDAIDSFQSDDATWSGFE